MYYIVGFPNTEEVEVAKKKADGALITVDLKSKKWEKPLRNAEIVQEIDSLEELIKTIDECRDSFVRRQHNLISAVISASL